MKVSEQNEAMRISTYFFIQPVILDFRWTYEGAVFTLSMKLVGAWAAAGGVSRRHGHLQAARGGTSEREEGAVRRQAEADAEEPRQGDAQRPRQGGRRGASRRLAHAQGARGRGPPARDPRALEDGQGRAQARRRAREVAAPPPPTRTARRRLP